MAKKRPGKPQLTPDQIRQKANEKALAGLYGAEGVNAGNALMNKFLQPGALGRVSTEVPGGAQSLERYNRLQASADARDPMQTDVLSRMKAGLGGYTSPEYQAQREQMTRGLDSNLQTSLGQLAKSQARGKVYGAAASAQQSNALRADQDSRNNLEQDLYIKNIDEMQRRLSTYGEYGRGLNQEEFDRRASATKGYGDEAAKLREDELERQKINLGQSNAELAAQIGAFTGAGGTALTKAQTKAAQRIQQKGISLIK